MRTRWVLLAVCVVAVIGWFALWDRGAQPWGDHDAPTSTDSDQSPTLGRHGHETAVASFEGVPFFL